MFSSTFPGCLLVVSAIALQKHHENSIYRYQIIFILILYDVSLKTKEYNAGGIFR